MDKKEGKREGWEGIGRECEEESVREGLSKVCCIYLLAIIDWLEIFIAISATPMPAPKR